MEMSNGVANCLFAGISSRIDYLKNYGLDLGTEAVEAYIRDITEALAFYQVECFISGAYLDAKYMELVALVAARSTEKEANVNDETEPT